MTTINTIQDLLNIGEDDHMKQLQQVLEKENANVPMDRVSIQDKIKCSTDACAKKATYVFTINNAPVYKCWEHAHTK